MILSTGAQAAGFACDQPHYAVIAWHQLIARLIEHHLHLKFEPTQPRCPVPCQTALAHRVPDAQSF